MTATLDAVTHSNGQFQDEDQVDSLDSSIPLDQDEDQTVRPNGLHLEQLVPAQTPRTTLEEPSNLSALRVSPPTTPGVTYDHDRLTPSPQLPFTHTEVTAGNSDRSNRRRSIMDVRFILLRSSSLMNFHPAQQPLFWISYQSHRS